MVVGLTVMVVAMATGLGAFFAAYPAVYEVLKYVGFAYVLYMAWGIYRAAMPQAGQDENSRGTTVVKASLFQLVNPKAWIVIATYVTAYVPSGQGLAGAIVAALVFVLATMPGAAVWVALGRLVGRFLSTPRAQKIFTTVMAIALVASMIPALFI
jgi:threonine/homoserine/homoserine lactone efflux protein